MTHKRWKAWPIPMQPRERSNIGKVYQRYRVLIVTVVSAVMFALGWFTWQLSTKYIRTRELVRDINFHGWIVHTNTRRFRMLDKGFLSDEPDDVRFFGTEIRGIEARGPACDDQFLSRLFPFHDIRSVIILNAPVSDSGIASLLANAPNIGWLDLEGCPIGDEAVKSIVQLRNLEGLILDRTNVTDDSIAGIRSMSTLRHLSLRDTRVSDSALAPFKLSLNPILDWGQEVRSYRNRWTKPRFDEPQQVKGPLPKTTKEDKLGSPQ